MQKTTNDPPTQPNPVYETVLRNKPSSANDKQTTQTTSGDQLISADALPIPVQPEVPLPTSTSLSSIETLPEPVVIIENAAASTTDVPFPQQSSKINTDLNNQESVIESVSHDELNATMLVQSAEANASLQLTGEQRLGSETALLPKRRYSYGRHADSSTNSLGEPVQEAHSYLYFTIVAAIVVGLCLDFIVLLACFVPALWFANKV